MAQNKQGSEKKAGVKIQDLSPKKDAKGGGTRNLQGSQNLDGTRNLEGQNLDGTRNVDSAGGGKGAA